ncbi:MAG: sulfotransferase family protein [Bacteroidota bacterium]
MKKIQLWSGPRNISTALMYSFAQRSDTKVVDEPLYAHYLSRTAAFNYHPGADEVLDSQEQDGGKVVNWMMKVNDAPVYFFKQMAHHLIQLDWDFMKNCHNVILTRDPGEMILSYRQQVEMPSLYDLGYEMQVAILNYLQENDLPVIVLDAKRVLLDPKKVLTELCERLGIPFDQNMLQWKAGARPEDGVWAKYWYGSVHQSTGFAPYRPKTEAFPHHLAPLLASAKPYYEQLVQLAI